MSIENFKKILESEREILGEKYHGNERGNWGPDFKAGHEAATNRLLPLLQKAVEMVEFVDLNTSLCPEHRRNQTFRFVLIMTVTSK